MNCKQDDIAIITGSHGGNNGKIVQCLEFLGSCLTRYPDGLRMTDWWRIDVALPSMHGDDWAAECQDEILRPIRDQPGTDESLTWAPVPAVRTKVAT